MPAATPKPTLEELLIILSRVSHLEASFPDGFGSAVPNGDTITLKYTFKREHLGPAAKVVFEYPSTIFSSLKEQLEFDDVLERAYRGNDPRNTVADVIGYFEQKRSYIRGDSLANKMDAAFFDSALRYLRELDRRRRESDRREAEAAQARRKRDEEEIKRKVEEEIRRREQERQRTKEEARRRWEEEEAKKRKWQGRQTNDSGFTRNPFEDIFRQSGIDPNDPIFKEAFRKASYGGFDYSHDFYGGSKSNRQSPPPSNGKRKWFEILGCHPSSSCDQIRAAARKAAKGLHPDTSTDPQAKEKFQAISEAKAEGLKGCAV